MKRLDSVLIRDNNSFDIVRLLAALMVVLGHSFALFKNNNYADPVRYFLKDDYSGSLAVYIFFFLSGLFISSSIVNAKNLQSFVLMRVFRIWPALIVCILLTVFIAGPLVTKFTLTEYFTHKTTWRYLIGNVLLHPVQIILPGCFESNFHPNNVNGSLWTPPLEVACYFMILLPGIFGVFKSKLITIALFLLIFVAYLFNQNLLAVYTNRPVPFFLAGSFCFFIRKYIFIDYRLFIGMMAVLLFFNSRVLFYFSWVYLALLLGSAPVLKEIKLPGDYSYGIYIYGFLVQQLLSHYIPGLNSLNSLFFSVPLLFLIGSFSWRFIEFPAIKFGKRIARYAIVKSRNF